MRLTRGERTAVALATVVAACIQYWMLTRRGLWTDETIAVRIANAPTLAEAWRRYLELEQQPPLSNVLIAAFTRLLGYSDAAVRLPSTICTVAAVPLLAYVGRRLTTPRAALVAAWLFAVSPFTALFGPMGLYYGLTLALSLGATALLLRAGERSSTLRWIAYCVALTGLLMTNATSVGIVAGHAPLGLRRGSRKQWLAAAAVATVVLGAWLIWDAPRLASMRQHRPFQPAAGVQLALLLLYPLYAFGVGETILPWRPVAAAGMLAVCVALASSLRRIHRRPERAAALIAFSILGTALAIFAVYARDRPFESLPSRAIAALPFVLVLVAAGAMRLRHRLGVVVIAAIVASSVVSIGNAHAGREYHSPIYAVDAPQILGDVLARARTSDVIAADHDMAIEHYYRAGPDVPRLILTGDAPGNAPRLWTITLGRDGTRTPERIDAPTGYQQISSWGYVPEDPVLRRVKQRIQGYPDYRYKATVRLYVRRT